MNITLLVPEGSSTHGNPSLLCSPPKWYDYIIFFGANYFAHAATVVSEPGQNATTSVLVALLVLFFPVSGLTRAVRAIRSRAIFEKDPVRRAAKAGALVMVTDWRDPKQQPDWSAGAPARPADSSEPVIARKGPQPWWARGTRNPFSSSSKVAGIGKLKEGYELTLVPRDAPVGEIDKGGLDEAVPSTYSFPKLAISLIQATWAIITIYRARGDQVQQYGYAAFGLTVVPYALMSILNTLGNILMPEYASLTLIRTPVLVEAMQGQLDDCHALRIDLGPGALGDSTQIRAKRGWYQSSGFIAIPLGMMPLVVVGVLSGFKPGASSPLERGFALAWLLCGVVCGPLIDFVCRIFVGLYSLQRWDAQEEDDDEKRSNRNLLLQYLAVSIVLASPAVGGMVIVGLQLRSFGICTLLS
jgi:hypothetical protein